MARSNQFARPAQGGRQPQTNDDDPPVRGSLRLPASAEDLRPENRSRRRSHQSATSRRQNADDDNANDQPDTGSVDTTHPGTSVTRTSGPPEVSDADLARPRPLEREQQRDQDARLAAAGDQGGDEEEEEEDENIDSEDDRQEHGEEHDKRYGEEEDEEGEGNANAATISDDDEEDDVDPVSNDPRTTAMELKLRTITTVNKAENLVNHTTKRLAKLNNRGKKRRLNEKDTKRRDAVRWELGWYQRKLNELKGGAHAAEVDDDDASSSSPPPAQEQPTQAARKAITTVPSLPEVDDEEAGSSPAAAANSQPTKSQRKKGITTKPRVPEKRVSETTKTKGKQNEPCEAPPNTRRNGGITANPSVPDEPGSEEGETQDKQQEPDRSSQTWVHDPKKEWKVRGIIDENKRAYKIAWKGYDKQGKEWEPTWESKGKVN